MGKWLVRAAAAALLPCIVGSAAASEADSGEVREGEWGAFKGRFVFDGPAPERQRIRTVAGRGCEGEAILDDRLIVEPKRGGIKNVLVYLHTLNAAAHPDYLRIKGTEVRLDHVDCRFEPRVFALTLDQTLVVRNRGTVATNVAAAPPRGAPFNHVLPPDQSFKVRFHEEERVPVAVCSHVHFWMRSYVLPCPHPYFAVSDDEGRFEIEKLPAGFLEFRAWHECSGFLSPNSAWHEGGLRGVVKATILGGEADDLGEIKVDPALLAAQP